ncbi:MAG: efflux transporter periplasmic adaptor subunit [Bacillota bacterium]|nr:efflux transporter periplasmic adaptor subunit [Bacillota bacterium]
MEQNIEKEISKKRLSKWIDRLEASKAAAILSSIIGKVPLLKKINQLNKRNRRIVCTSFLLVIVIGASAAATGFFKGDKKEVSYTEHEVAKGDVTVVISGEGTVSPIEQYSVIALVEGDVLEDTFQEGDTVEKGQTLYRIDSSDMEKTLEKANISYEKAQMEYQDSLEAYQGLTVSAPISGRVTDVLVEKGDNVSNGTKIATIVDDSNLTAKVSFGTADAGSLYAGQPVTVTVENTFEELKGKISKIYSSKRVLDGYIEVKDVEVTIENPGALDSGTYVTVNAGGIDCYNGAQLEGGTEKIVTAKTSGLVSKILASSGEYLSKGDGIIQLTNDGADNTLKSSQFSLRESQLSYESSQDQLDEYNVTAPISGTVIEKDIKAGDTLESSNSGSTTLCVIADMSVMTFTINVDELDIAQLEKGQEVTISADALSDRDFTGYVDNIGILGTSSDGVTSYPVKIVINDAEDLWPGMNVSAEIIVDSAEDVLRVPVTAVNRGNTVLVKGAKGDEKINQSSAPDGAQYVRVEMGLNDESYIEIKGGLSEGDIVLVPKVKSSSAESSAQQQMMPAGGMSGPPSGGGGMSGPPSGGGGRGM